MIEIITEMLTDPQPQPPNTRSQMEVWGTTDPVPYEYGYTEDESTDYNVSLKKNGRRFLTFASKCQGITDCHIDEWFGVARNQVRDRAVMLVENGHVNPATTRVIKAKQKVKVGVVPKTIWIFESKVVASQKTRVYLCRIAFNQDFTKILGRPYSSCECVVRRGPACSHQLALLLYILVIAIVLERLGEDICWSSIAKHLPDWIIVVQKTPTTVNYAYGNGNHPHPNAMHTHAHTYPYLVLTLIGARSRDFSIAHSNKKLIRDAKKLLMCLPAPCDGAGDDDVGANSRVDGDDAGAADCSFKDRCVSVGRQMVKCGHTRCKRRVHLHCWNTFGGASDSPRCAEHASRPLCDIKMTARDKSKKLLHLPNAWANRWVRIDKDSLAPENLAKMTVEAINEDTEREVNSFPRTPRDQLECDIMHERDFALIAKGLLPSDDLWSYYLSCTRATRLQRIRTNNVIVNGATTSPDITQNTCPAPSNASKVRSLIPGRYEVIEGPDKGHRLIVRDIAGRLDGYYVYDVDSRACTPDQFSIQVTDRGHCTLLSVAVLTGNYSKKQTEASTWVLDIGNSTRQKLYWTNTKVNRIKLAGRIRELRTKITIVWKRANETTTHLFSGRGTPRTPPQPVHSAPRHPRRKSGGNKCACGDDSCANIANAIAREFDIDRQQKRLIKKKKVFSSCDPPKKRKRLKRVKDNMVKEIMVSEFNEQSRIAFNKIRHANGSRALRANQLNTARVNMVCHYPVSFLTNPRKRKASSLMVTTPSDWGCPDESVFDRRSAEATVDSKIKGIFSDYKPKAVNTTHRPEVFCCPRFSCEHAMYRWRTHYTNMATASPQITTTPSDNEESVPITPGGPYQIVWNDDITYEPMHGSTQPSNWSGHAKYLWMNEQNHIKDPGEYKLRAPSLHTHAQ